jgi:hypothetical protein
MLEKNKSVRKIIDKIKFLCLKKHSNPFRINIKADLSARLNTTNLFEKKQYTYKNCINKEVPTKN